MRKLTELHTVNSCLNKATDNEMLFVLLGRDKAAPDAIRCWVQKRLLLGLNNVGDVQINEALQCADTMEREQNGG